MDEYKRQFILNLLAYAVQRNVSPLELCRLASVDLPAIKKGTAVPITSKQMNDLWLNAMHVTKDAAFGLHFGESLQLSALGVVGQIIQSSQTVGEALTQAAQSIHLITDVVSMGVSLKGKRIVVELSESKKPGVDAVVVRQLMEFFTVFTIHELDGLILERIAPLKCTLQVNNDADTREYERVLRCKPQRNLGNHVLEFEGRYWDVPILTANYELQRLMLEKIGQQSSFSAKQISTSERVLNYLTTNAYLGTASLGDVAANFNTTPRTLQRKLHEEGVTFQQLADSVRKTVAMHYLESGNYPMGEVSHMLGYNELSAFTRAFKRWTGKTPGDFQRGS